MEEFEIEILNKIKKTSQKGPSATLKTLIVLRDFVTDLIEGKSRNLSFQGLGKKEPLGSATL